jgi:hypothetical protein
MKNYFLDRAKITEECIWDFEIALGETIREKYGSEFKLIEYNNIKYNDPWASKFEVTCTVTIP